MGVSLMLIRKQLRAFGGKDSLDELCRSWICGFHLQALLLHLLVKLDVEGHAAVDWQLLLHRFLLG